MEELQLIHGSSAVRLAYLYIYYSFLGEMLVDHKVTPAIPYTLETRYNEPWYISPAKVIVKCIEQNPDTTNPGITKSPI